MSDTTTPLLPVFGSRCWRDLISTESSVTVLSFSASSSDADPLVELVYDEGGRGRWPLSTLLFEQG